MLNSGTLGDVEVVRAAVGAEIEYLQAASVPTGSDGERWVAVAVQEGQWRDRLDGYRCLMSRCDDGDAAVWLEGAEFADGKPESSYRTPQEELYRGRVAAKLAVSRAIHGHDGPFPITYWWPHRLT